MKEEEALEALADVVATVLATSFALAAGAKLSALGEFSASTVRAVPWLSSSIVVRAVSAIPFIELATAVWLTSGWHQQVAFGMALALLAVFTITLVTMNRNSECHCYGRIFQRWRNVSISPYVRNLTLTAFAVAGLIGSVTADDQQGTGAAPWITVATFGVAAAAWLIGRRQTPQRGLG